jgi:molybdopterin-guanine dinucleotide biosynthesis adapter protein
MPHDKRVFGVSGWKNSGKTTLLAALVEELTRQGYRVSTVKHAHHNFNIDHKGRDSWRHREAGARETAIISASRWALMHELRDESEPTLTDMLSTMSPCDLVLVEGYKRESHPKIEVLGLDDAEPPLWHSDPTIVAIAGEAAPEGCDIPFFHRADATAIAEFIVYHQALPPVVRKEDHGG